VVGSMAVPSERARSVPAAVAEEEDAAAAEPPAAAEAATTAFGIEGGRAPAVCTGEGMPMPLSGEGEEEDVAGGKAVAGRPPPQTEGEEITATGPDNAEAAAADDGAEEAAAGPLESCEMAGCLAAPSGEPTAAKEVEASEVARAGVERPMPFFCAELPSEAAPLRAPVMNPIVSVLLVLVLALALVLVLVLVLVPIPEEGAGSAGDGTPIGGAGVPPEPEEEAPVKSSGTPSSPAGGEALLALSTNEPGASVPGEEATALLGAPSWELVPCSAESALLLAVSSSRDPDVATGSALTWFGPSCACTTASVTSTRLRQHRSKRRCCIFCGSE
jgi:hypothetical protein